MRTRLNRCRAPRPRLRHRATAALSVGLVALLILACSTAALATAAPTTPAPAARPTATPTPTNLTPQLAPTGVQAQLVQLPSDDLSNSGLLSTLSLGGLGGLLGLKPEEALAALSPQALEGFLAQLTQSVTPTQIQQLLAGLAKGNLSGEELTSLHAIVGALTQGLSTEGITALRTQLGKLATGLSEGELAALQPAELAQLIDSLFTTATPTEIAPLVGSLLSGLNWSDGTTESLAQTLEVPVSTLASTLGEAGSSGFSSLPVLTSEVGPKGQVVGVLDRAHNLALGLLGAEGGEPGNGGSGSGGSGSGGSGSGGSGSGGSGGGSGSGNSGSGSNPGSSGNSSSGAGGNGGSAGSGLPGSDLTLTLTLPSADTSRANSPSSAVKSTKVQVLSKRVRGRIATVALQVPSAGRLVLSGRGVRTTTAKLSKGGRVTLTASLSSARMASLRRTHQHLRVRLTARFKSTKGSSSSAAFTVTFA
jgi:hypothetical protein